MRNIDVHYGVYLEKVFQLAKTLVIKSDAFIHLMNEQVRIRAGQDSVDPYRPETWRYYMNVCGEYHPQDIFELKGKIRIVSMDTLEEIEFTKENLALHRTTFKEYQYGTRKYEELIVNYPQYEMLILGILYPANMQEAIDGPDGKILSYKPDLVETNEYTFLEELQRWIYAYKVRWTNRHFADSDGYYDVTNIAVLYLNLVSAILTIRKRKCKTNEAHSYHVRQYLASHGFLDDYLDVLTTKQALRFYRNINYLERNIGKVDTFKWLTREVMTERNLPLAEYSMYHDTEFQDVDIYPEPVFKKKSINGLEAVTEEDHISTSVMLDKETPLAPYNHQFRQDNEYHIQRDLQNSLSNKLKTKVLESKVTDYTDAQVYRMSDTLLNLWLDWSDRGLYKSVIMFNNIKTGERLPLYAKDAFYVFWYCYWKWMGLTIDRPPEILAQRVPIFPVPSKETLFSVVPTTPRISLREKYAVEEQFADDILSLMPTFNPVISIEAFYNKAQEFNVAANMQYNLTTLEEEMDRRAYKEAMTHRLYADRMIQPPTDTLNYEQWLDSLALRFPNMSVEDWRTAALAIINEATGVNLNTTLSLRALHAAMVRLMMQLSSYSLQYLKDINLANILIAGDSSLRLSQPKVHEKASMFALNGLKIEDLRSFTRTFLGHLLDEESFSQLTFGASEKSSIEVDHTVDVIQSSKPRYRYHVYTGIDVYHAKVELDENPRGVIPLPGMNDYVRLPFSEQRKGRDVWGNDYYYSGHCTDEYSTKDPIEWVIPKDLDGFDYVKQERLRLPGVLDGFTYVDKVKLRLDKPLGGFNYKQANPLVIGDLFGFTYKEAPLLYLPYDLNGFTYKDDKPFLTLDKPLNGFTYKEAKPFDLPNDLDGFQYQSAKPWLELNRPLRGFTYHTKVPFNLNGDLNGFIYSNDKKLSAAIDKSLKGFKYQNG